ncbi:sigma-70 family RNA polymerase sigma factor [Paenibacillus sp. KQZ6P-2]|uniref:Sigma-70 family RNA polymerase sigma factor n=1 Tax=Paenibacillus mangrovi TaxID=2931978 RepID=A0A9X1WSZ9_9BACL|nr:sigma-70 family RNA polymerase sigma factor [Paenibacillus mangrovi]MCJ8014453.1 sigma-70 family RNA polymerase sigma factor [Paenibacillus mangrovi]
MHHLSDYELMLLVKQKEQEALSILYDRYVSLIYSFAYKALRDEQAARDIVQSVYVRLWTTDSEFNPDKGKFTSWLITITRNLTMDWLRQQRRRSSGLVAYLPEELERIPDQTPSPEAHVERDSLKEQVRSAYRFLSKQQIELVEDFYWRGYSLRELAEHYKEPLGTVKNRLHQALKILRRHLVVEGEG